MKNLLLLLLLLVASSGQAWAQSPIKLIDPMRPAHYQSPSQVDQQLNVEQIDALRGQFQLTAILMSAERAMAVINGRPLQVDQSIGDFRLAEIGADYVVLRRGEQILTLYRTISGVKKSPAHRSDTQ